MFGGGGVSPERDVSRRGGRVKKGKDSSFLKKRSKKLFSVWSRGEGLAWVGWQRGGFLA
jgi:hypothetical protein